MLVVILELVANLFYRLISWTYSMIANGRPYLALIRALEISVDPKKRHACLSMEGFLINHSPFESPLRTGWMSSLVPGNGGCKVR